MTRLLLLAALFPGVCAPAQLAAQVIGNSAQEWLEKRQMDYGTAKEQHEADSSRFATIEYEWNQLLEELGEASEKGNNGRVRQLLAEFQDRSYAKNLAENAWRTSQEEWTAAGEALISAIDAYLETIWNSIESSVGSPEDEALYNQWARELDMLEGELPQEPLTLEAMPEVEIRDGDTSTEILYKARSIEHRVGVYEKVLDELDRDIESLTKRLRREEKRRDARGGRERFDAPAPTGDQRRPLSADAPVGDTTASNRALEPLDVRIRKKTDLREQVEDRMEKLKQKAEEFKKRAEGTG